jgi:DNA polymerase III epsilon subunit-like protein
MDLTIEQQNVVDAISNGISVSCDSVAGSGKTTTILHIAIKNPNKRILMFTYNSALRHEVKDKACQMNLKNIEIHTYHSSYVKYYNSSGKDDYGILASIGQNPSPRNKICYDIFVVDEAQDMSLLYFNVVNMFLNDNTTATSTLLVMGDYMQGIYKFKGADPRFLTMGGTIWKREMATMQLTDTFRLTNQIASYINNTMLPEKGAKKLVAHKNGPNVTQIIGNIYKANNIILNEIKSLLSSKQFVPEDIFVIVPSVRSEKAPFKHLENQLVDMGVPCYVPSSDSDKSGSKDTMRGKIVFCTIHQSKGRERKVVILYNYDSNYFKYYNRDACPLRCPEELYVATTRASEKMYLISDIFAESLPFLREANTSVLAECLEVIGGFKKTAVVHEHKYQEHRTSVTDLVRFLKMDAYVEDIKALFTIECHQTVDIHMPEIKTCQSGLSEEVSDINGYVVQMLYEGFVNNNKLDTIVHRILRSYHYVNSNNISSYIENKIDEALNLPCEAISDYLQIANLYISTQNGVNCRLAQIDKYDWLDDVDVNRFIDVMFDHIDKNKIDAFEKSIKYKLIHQIENTMHTVEISGRMDIVEQHVVWEIKCVNEITVEHMLQTIIYAWMWFKNKENQDRSKVFRLFNVRTGEIYVLDTSYIGQNAIESVMISAIEEKYSPKKLIADDEFVASGHSVIERIVEAKKISTVSKDEIFLVFDTETTGLPYHDIFRMVSIAWMICTRSEVLHSFYTLVKPDGFEIPLSSTYIHGISTKEALQDGVDIQKVLERLISDVKEYGVTHMVAHNITFDMGVLSEEFSHANIFQMFQEIAILPRICTYQRAKQTLVDRPSYKLVDIYRLSISDTNTDGITANAHNAKYDVEMCYAVLQFLFDKEVVLIPKSKPQHVSYNCNIKETYNDRVMMTMTTKTKTNSMYCAISIMLAKPEKVIAFCNGNREAQKTIAESATKLKRRFKQAVAKKENVNVDTDAGILQYLARYLKRNIIVDDGNKDVVVYPGDVLSRKTKPRSDIKIFENNACYMAVL